MTRTQSAAYARACNICKEAGLQNPGRPEPIPTRIPLIPMKPATVTISEEDFRKLYDAAKENYEMAARRVWKANEYDHHNAIEQNHALGAEFAAKQIFDKVRAIRRAI